MLTLLTNGRIFTGTKWLSNHSVLLKGKHIAAVFEHSASLPKDTFIKAANSTLADLAKHSYDLQGRYLAPGFIDTQVNGGGDVLFNDQPNRDGLKAMFGAHRAYGTTAMLPTLITDHRDVMEQAIKAVDEAMQEGMAGIVGIHLEGPYLNVDKKGVHRENVIRQAESDAVALLTRLTQGKTLVTLAPEKQPIGFIRQLVEQGIRVNIGHSNATYDEVKQALAEGVTGFTHLFNAMSMMQGREPGVVGAALEDQQSWCGIITDGEHVHPASLAVAIAAKPKGKTLLVTDAMHSVGSDKQSFDLFAERIYRHNGKITTKEGVLAGSDLTMIGAVKNTVALIGLSLGEALKMASRYPAEFLGLDDRLGYIRQGYQANLLCFDDGYQVHETWIAGDLMQHQG